MFPKTSGLLNGGTSHQPLHPLPVDPVPLPSQVVCHSPAAVERMPGELLIDQLKQVQLFGIWFIALWLQIECRAIRPDQFALPSQRYRLLSTDPASPSFHRDIPDFFFNHSSSILSRPISE